MTSQLVGGVGGANGKNGSDHVSGAGKISAGTPHAAGQGASSLMGLFAPPPTTAKAAGSSVEASGASSGTTPQTPKTEESAPAGGHDQKASSEAPSSSSDAGSKLPSPILKDPYFHTLFTDPNAAERPVTERTPLLLEESELMESDTWEQMEGGGDAMRRSTKLMSNALMARRSTKVTSNERLVPIKSLDDSEDPDTVPPLTNLFTKPSSSLGSTGRANAHTHSHAQSYLIPRNIQETKPPTEKQLPTFSSVGQSLVSVSGVVVRESLQQSTVIGSLMFLLYHIVFCLTMGSAITRPSMDNTSDALLLGLMAKMAALGVIFGAPTYWIGLSCDIPALYPTVDLFTAPFLAKIAAIIDKVIVDDPDIDNPTSDPIFLGTFSALAVVASLGTSVLLGLASVFKLVNLGSYLPFPVLAGFFAAVGVLTWTLAFKIDSGGVGIGEVLWSGNAETFSHGLLHHLPSLVIAALMKTLGPMHPFYVIGMVVASIPFFYLTMWSLGVTREEAIEQGWFWAGNDLIYEPMNASLGFKSFAPPVPLGWVNSIVGGDVHWGAFYAGLETTAALSFLYLIRCSLHAAALRRNVTNLSRAERVNNTTGKGATQPETPANEKTMNFSGIPKPPGGIGNRETSADSVDNLPPSRVRFRGMRMSSYKPKRKERQAFSEVLDVGLFAGLDEEATLTDQNNNEDEVMIVSARPTSRTLPQILTEYCRSHFLVALVGSFPVAPSVAASPTMYLLRAEKVAPQLGSCLLLLAFYLKDFRVVTYIPKPAFSSLLVLAFFDMIYTWFYKSYFRTKEKIEWLVVPIIVVSANVLGLLNAVFLGIAMSTFFFVASFFRSGVVKYISSGQNIRSTIERTPDTALWLDQHGDMIQVVVLQNYLFFGNASSMLNYIGSMFEEPIDEIDPSLLPPLPKIIILDLSLVTGMDTSAVDIFADILNICDKYDCKLFLSGVLLSIRKAMELSGFKPDHSQPRHDRKLRFFQDLDSAIGKAEDMLLSIENIEQQIHPHHHGVYESGFRHALEHIDKQHGLRYADDLADLEPYVQSITVNAGEIIYEDVVTERGLFFVEHGVIKVEVGSDGGATLTRSGFSDTFSKNSALHSLNGLHARSMAMFSKMKNIVKNMRPDKSSSFRVARVGPGHVLGSAEALTGDVHPAQFVPVTRCELHFISYQKVEELEETHPTLVLKLHKLLSYLMAKRQSLAITQLAQLHDIMSSPAQKRPIGRVSSHGQLPS